MPLRYTPRPAPRIWVPNPPRRPQAPTYGAPRGGKAAGAAPGVIPGVDTTPTGNPGIDLVKAINAWDQTRKMNAAANQLMNTQNAPRAGLVAPGINPQTGQPNVIQPGVSLTGTDPQTGGYAQLQLQQQQAAQQQAADQANLADTIKRAQLAKTLAQTRQIGMPRTSGKPAGYVAGTGDVQNDPNTDNFNQIQADFDAQHGKGTYNAFTKNLSNLRPDGQGNLVVMRPPGTPDANGNPTKDWTPVTDKNGMPVYSIPATDATYWQQRYNAARVKSGQSYLGDLPAGANPNSGVQSGQSQVNPIPVTDNLTARSLPNGTWIQLPDKSVKQINRTPQQAAAAGQPQGPTVGNVADQTSSTDTSDQDSMGSQEGEEAVNG